MLDPSDVRRTSLTPSHFYFLAFYSVSTLFPDAMSDRPSLKEIAVAISDLTWSEVTAMAVQMGVDLHTCTQIKEQYAELSDRKLYSMNTWLQNDPEPSWAKIVSALRSISKSTVATKIEQQYGQPPQKTMGTCMNESSPSLPSHPLVSIINSPKKSATSTMADTPTTSAVVASISDYSTSSACPPSFPVLLPSKHVDEVSSSPIPASSAVSQVDQPTAVTTQPQSLSGLCGTVATHSDKDRVNRVAEEASTLQAQFVSVLTCTKINFSEKEAGSHNFLIKFRITLTTLPVSDQFKHLLFLRERKHTINKATTTDEVFDQLDDHWNYMDYALLQHLVKEFGDGKLQQMMGAYVAELELFEKKTTIRDFIAATSGYQYIPYDFSRAVLRLQKDASECTLYEIRQLKESMRKQSSLNAYTILLEGIHASSVVVTLAFPIDVLEMIISAMNSDFLTADQVISVTIDEKPLEEYNTEYLKGLQLLRASQEGNEAAVISLLYSGVDPDFGHTDGACALHWASKGGQTGVVKALLQNRADVHRVDKDGSSVLQWACKSGHTEVATVLLDHGAGVHGVDKDGRTALHWACRRGRVEIVMLLLNYGAYIDAEDADRCTGLQWASRYGHLETVQLLLQYRADPNRLDWWKRSALLLAAENGHTRTVEILVQNGADVNTLDRWGRHALIIATWNGRKKTVEILAQEGALLDVQDEDALSALMFACAKGYAEITHVLAQYGADLNAHNAEGMTALMIAVKGGWTAIVHILLEGRADVNIQENSTGWTALFFAAKDGNLEITKLLIRAGANVLHRDMNGVTALDVARVYDRGSTCEALSRAQPTQTATPLGQQTKPATDLHMTPKTEHMSTAEKGRTLSTLRNVVNKSVQMITDAYRELEKKLKSTTEKEVYQNHITGRQDE